MAAEESDQLYAIVDMGSNGIRFSITSLAPPTTRSLPTLYQSRLGISLYDAQYENNQKVPIPSATTENIIAALKRFRQTSIDFGVPQERKNVRILATEATRTALNGSEFIDAIEKSLGEPWKVDKLKKEDEGRIGALGVISSVGGRDGVEGLMMDLGGGSTQITYLIARPGEPLETSAEGSISFPYGAAAMAQLLKEVEASKDPEESEHALRSQMVSQFHEAFEKLDLPASLLSKARSTGLTLYLSGGGFRGWGYLLMSSHKIRPYPIPIINGFCAPVADFKDTAKVKVLAQNMLEDKASTGVGIFRVSKRRAAQVPGVSFLVDALITAIPTITQVRFCQGGVREGWLFKDLADQLKAEDPLLAASGRLATDMASAKHFAQLLAAALPPDNRELDRSINHAVTDPSLLRAFANLLFLQQGQAKEAAAVNALTVPITGILAPVHGAGHTERALLSLMLCQRWGDADDLPPPYDDLRSRLECLLTHQQVWWARYLGVIGGAVGEVYPAGRVRKGQERLKIAARWDEGLGKKGNQQGVVVELAVMEGELGVGKGVMKDIVKRVEDLGKKKNRVGGKEYGFGVALRVDVEALT